VGSDTRLAVVQECLAKPKESKRRGGSPESPFLRGVRYVMAGRTIRASMFYMTQNTGLYIPCYSAPFQSPCMTLNMIRGHMHRDSAAGVQVRIDPAGGYPKNPENTPGISLFECHSPDPGFGSIRKTSSLKNNILSAR
jgi:hypothetical protein